MKLIVLAVALCFLAAGAALFGVTGSTPDRPTGRHPVKFEAATLAVSGRAELGGAVSTMDIDVGLWIPDIAAAPRSLPLVIYAPSWGSNFNDNTVLLREIASHGYGVVAIADIAQGPRPPWYTADDDGARRAAFDIRTPDKQAQFMEDAERRTALSAARISQALDAIGRSQATDKRFDLFGLDVVGAIGASFGGAAVAEAALSDGRVGLAINLDGLVFGKASRVVIRKPYIEFNSTIGAVPISEAGSNDPIRRFLAQTNIRQIARQAQQRQGRLDAFDITIRGTLHPDFTDGLYDRRRIFSWRPWRERPARPARVRAIIDGFVVAALDEWIGSKYGRFTRIDRAAFPEVEILGGVP